MSGIDQYTKLLLHNDGDDFVGAGRSVALFGGNSSYVGGTGFSYPAATIAGWVNANSVTTAQHVLAQDLSGANCGDFALDLGQITSSKFTVTFDRRGCVEDDYFTITSNTVAAGKWYFVTVTMDATETKIYLDGVLNDTGSGFPYLGNNSAPFIMGGASYLPSAVPFVGKMSDVTLHSRVLSESEISQLRSDHTSGIMTVTDGLVAHYPLDADFNDAVGDNDYTAFGDVTIGNNSGHTYSTNGSPMLTSIGKFGGSMLFNGTSYIDVPASVDFGFGTDDFTIDFWMNETSGGTYTILSGGSGDARWKLQVSNNWGNRIELYVGNGSSWSVFDGGPGGYIGTTDLYGAWHHIAFVRNGTSAKVYVDGTAEIDATLPADFSFVTDNRINIGYVPSMQYYVGYMDELRVSNGIARWTADFTPSATPYTPDLNTALLLHFDGNVANSEHNASVIGNVDASASVFKFDGSYYFDGSAGNYLNLGDSPDWNFGTRDFTLEAWIYKTDASYGYIMGTRNVPNYEGWWLEVDPSNHLRFRATSVGSSWTVDISDTVAFTAGEWVHVALSRVNGVFNLYKNGVSIGSASDSGSLINGSVLTVGQLFGVDTDTFKGYIDEVRISNGTSRWSENFTPPTSAYTTGYTYDENDVLLLHFEEEPPVDSSLKEHTVTMNGNVTVLGTSEYKFGANSAYFDGSGYLTVADSTDWDFQNNTYTTIEFWLYPVLISQDATAIVGQAINWADSATFIYLYTNGRIGIGQNGVSEIASAAGTITTNSWQHVAVVKNGTTTLIFVNGTQVASSTTGIWVDSSNPLSIGGTSGTQPNFVGYIDELKISKTAQWMSSFTPPDGPYDTYTGSIDVNYGISGDNNYAGRVIVIDETSWAIESNDLVDANGYSISTVDNSPKVVIFIKDDGEVMSRANVTPAQI